MAKVIKKNRGTLFIGIFILLLNAIYLLIAGYSFLSKCLTEQYCPTESIFHGIWILLIILNAIYYILMACKKAKSNKLIRFSRFIYFLVPFITFIFLLVIVWGLFFASHDEAKLILLIGFILPLLIFIIEQLGFIVFAIGIFINLFQELRTKLIKK